jgi:hypothetical protein
MSAALTIYPTRDFNTMKNVFDTKTIVFGSKRIVFEAKTVAFSAKRIVFGAKTAAFGAKRIVFEAKKIVFDTKRIVGNTKRIFLLFGTQSVEPGTLFSEAKSIICASETCFSIAEKTAAKRRRSCAILTVSVFKTIFIKYDLDHFCYKTITIRIMDSMQLWISALIPEYVVASMQSICDM